MAKEVGLGDQLYIAGYDISGDVGAIGTLSGSHGSREVTCIDKNAVERQLGLRDGEISFSGWWDTATGALFDALKSLPDTDMLVTYCRGATRGGQAANMIAKEGSHEVQRDSGGLAVSSQTVANAYGLDWGVQLTVGKETIAAAGNGTGVDLAASESLPVATAITSSSVANPTHVISTGHGMVTGDSCLIAGHTSTPTINGNWPVTRINDNEFTIPVNVTVGGGANGTVQKTSTNFGGNGYLQVFTHGSNTITVHIEDSADNVTFADVAGLAFTVASGRTAGERVGTTTATTIIRRYARIVTAGTFSNAIICCSLTRYGSAAG